MSMFRFAKWISEGEPVHLYGDGEQSRGFTYVDDIARGTIAALKPLGYEIINLGGHEVISMNGLITLLEEWIGKKATIEWHHQSGRYTDEPSRCYQGRDLLGWQPKWGSQMGLAGWWHGIELNVAGRIYSKPGNKYYQLQPPDILDTVMINTGVRSLRLRILMK